MAVTEHTALADLPEWLRPDEAARVLRSSPGLVYELAARGELEHRRFGRLLRIPRHAVATSYEQGGGSCSTTSGSSPTGSDTRTSQ